MVTKRIMVGVTGALLSGAALIAVPAIGADPATARTVPVKRVATAPRAIGGFTPAAADPRLAAALARAGIGAGNFRFTPTDSRRDGNRAITVAVRASSVGNGRTLASGTPASLSMAPIAYNLGAAVGWKKFALSGDLTRVDLGVQPGSREAMDLGVSFVDRRAMAQVKATADRPLPGAGPRLVEAPKSYSLDVNGTYSLTRNLDLTAGLRYKSDRDRLERSRDERRDSQAVYVGTAFRF